MGTLISLDIDPRFYVQCVGGWSLPGTAFGFRESPLAICLVSCMIKRLAKLRAFWALGTLSKTPSLPWRQSLCLLGSMDLDRERLSFPALDTLKKRGSCWVLERR